VGSKRERIRPPPPGQSGGKDDVTNQGKRVVALFSPLYDPSFRPPDFSGSGQSRTINVVLPVRGAGQYLIEFQTLYSGVDVVTGKIVPSNDAPIVAWAEAVATVPA
jgi:hypothetical protein